MLIYEGVDIITELPTIILQLPNDGNVFYPSVNSFLS